MQRRARWQTFISLAHAERPPPEAIPLGVVLNKIGYGQQCLNTK